MTFRATSFGASIGPRAARATKRTGRCARSAPATYASFSKAWTTIWNLLALSVRSWSGSNPDLSRRSRAVPSLQAVSDFERDRYLQAPSVDLDDAELCELVRSMRRNGVPTDRMDIESAFTDVRTAELGPGDMLLDAGSPAGLVYVALSPGLRGTPLGGFARSLCGHSFRSVTLAWYVGRRETLGSWRRRRLPC